MARRSKRKKAAAPRRTPPPITAASEAAPAEPRKKGTLRRLAGAVRKLFREDPPDPQEQHAARRAALLGALPEEEAERARRLDERRRYILQLADENSNLAGELLAEELTKLDDMVLAFVELASSVARWERHLKSVDWEELDGETRKYEDEAQKAIDGEQRRLARRNLDLLLKRREQLDDLKRNVTRHRSQLDLIESTFKMLGNQVLLMANPRELGAQLDDLRVGVEAVRETVGPEDLHRS